MRQRVAILGFFIIFLVVIAGCSSQAPSGTSSSAPPASALSPVSPAQPVSHDINSIQTFSRDGKSIAVSIDSITSIPGPTYDRFWIAVNYTFTNTGTEPLRIVTSGGGIITDYPHNKRCSDERTCNTTYFSISFVKGSLNPDGSFRQEESDILYPGVPRQVTSNTSFDKSDYGTLTQGGTISFSKVCIDSVSYDNFRCYEGWNEGLPRWKIDFAKDVTILPAR